MNIELKFNSLGFVFEFLEKQLKTTNEVLQPQKVLVKRQEYNLLEVSRLEGVDPFVCLFGLGTKPFKNGQILSIWMYFPKEKEEYSLNRTLKKEPFVTLQTFCNDDEGLKPKLRVNYEDDIIIRRLNSPLRILSLVNNSIGFAFLSQ